MTDWREYQEKAAQLFRELGFSAEIEAAVQGARATNKVDVLATYDHAGVKMTWAVECKYWNTRVPKEKVWAFRSVLHDIGADRGVLLAEKGYQKGALDAAQYSAMTLTLLDGLRQLASSTLAEQRLLAIPKRISQAYLRYWLLPKDFRIERGLRPDRGEYGYSGGTVLNALENLVTSALAGLLPPENMSLLIPVYTREEAATWGEDALTVLEAKLEAAEQEMPSDMAAMVARRSLSNESSERPSPSAAQIAMAREMFFDERPQPTSAQAEPVES